MIKSAKLQTCFQYLITFLVIGIIVFFYFFKENNSNEFSKKLFLKNWKINSALDISQFRSNNIDESIKEVNISEDVKNALVTELENKEYEINWQEITHAYQSPNRKHNFRTTYKPGLMAIQPRIDTLQNQKWHFELRLKEIKINDKCLKADLDALPQIENEKIGFKHSSGFVEEYINNKEGVRQNFIITGNKNIAFNGDISVIMEIEGNLKAEKVSSNEISFCQFNHSKVFSYTDLNVWDAKGIKLKAKMLLEKDNIILSVTNLKNATFPITIDPISSSTSTQVESNQTTAHLGFAATSAGDVNGDNYSDVVVSAYSYDNGQSNEGCVEIYHGSSSGISSSPSIHLEIDQANAYFGVSVSSAGDVNNDGYSDILCGAYMYDNGQTDEGGAFIYHGSASGITSTIQTQLENNQTDAYFGRCVALAGDVNNDGYSDILVGGFGWDNGETDEGCVRVYHGSSTGITSTVQIHLESNQANSFMANYSNVTSAGDVNGDGYSDIIIGAYNYDNGQTDEGAVFIYHGSGSGITSTIQTQLESNQTSASFGFSCSTSGDVNSDGYSDIIVGSINYDNGQTDEGAAFVYHGSASGVATTIQRQLEINQTSAAMGQNVSCAGDVNGDGYCDVVIGASYFDNGQTDEGAAFVYHGTSSGISNTIQTQIESNQTSATLGRGQGISYAGDVNGDGFSDIIVGDAYYDNGETDEGNFGIYHGSSLGISSIAIIQLEQNQSNAYLGFEVKCAGDVNADGYSDIIVGAMYYDNGQNDEGAAFIFHGSSTGITNTIQTQLEVNQINAQFGVSCRSAGDVNGDGYSDVIVGAWVYDNGESDEGAAFIFHGSGSGITSTVQTQLEINQASAYFGRVVACAGDVNADGYTDVIVGGYGYDNGQTDEGVAIIYHGSSSGILTTIKTQLESNQSTAYFGDYTSVNGLGDVNGDGYSDVAVGAYLFDNGETNEGAVFIYHGSSTGVSTTIKSQIELNQSWALFGHSVAGAGDVNGDGYCDIIVGAPLFDNGETDEGGAFIFYGSSSGITTTVQTQLEINQTSSDFGHSVTCAGDVNGDGYSDVVVAAQYYDNGHTDEGAAFIYHGSSSGISTTIQAQIESNQAYAALGKSGSIGSAGDVNGDGYSDVVVAAPLFDNGQTDEGAVWLFHGNNASSNIRNNLRLYENNLTTTIGAPNFNSSTFGMGLFSKSFLGKQKGKMCWQTKAQGVAFSGNPITNSVLITSSQGVFSSLGTGLEETGTVSKVGKATKVRARIKYDPVSSITGQVYGPWRYPSNYLMGGSFMNATPLPVELIDFEGSVVGGDVHLIWRTASEINSDYFTLERSEDGTNFEAIGTKKGAGTSIELTNYLIIDVDLKNTIYYYQLSQVDFDGKREYFDIISVDLRSMYEKEIGSYMYTMNLIGQEVGDQYRGLVIDVYSGGTTIKRIQ